MFLLEKGLVLKEEGGLPIGALPQCTSPGHMKLFVQGLTRVGLDPQDV